MPFLDIDVLEKYTSPFICVSMCSSPVEPPVRPASKAGQGNRTEARLAVCPAKTSSQTGLCPVPTPIQVIIKVAENGEAAMANT